MARVGRHVRVRGRVQGVYFRGWTKQQADELGVSGWVRNCEDGSVEAQFSGEEEAVTALIERLGDGPPSAVVSDVEAGVVEPQDDEYFEVRR